MENNMNWSDLALTESNGIEVLSAEQRSDVNGGLIHYAGLFIAAAITGLAFGNRIWPQRPATPIRVVNPNAFRIRAPRK